MNPSNFSVRGSQDLRKSQNTSLSNYDEEPPSLINQKSLKHFIDSSFSGRTSAIEKQIAKKEIERQITMIESGQHTLKQKEVMKIKCSKIKSKRKLILPSIIGSKEELYKKLKRSNYPLLFCDDE